jgi:hypothetical protein
MLDASKPALDLGLDVGLSLKRWPRKEAIASHVANISFDHWS